ncbi:MAG: carnitine dehydratase [Chloroflexi bacterium RBG_16_60_22]|nr:MAG: carnitine dehydratase [Chloroflexi bacterium RBG_16_60_22]
MGKPLEGIRVLDLTWVLSGPYSTMILGDLGAEVIKIERPEVGDIGRGNGPHVNGVSTYFLSLNRGKKSVVLNLASPKGREIFLRLVKQADIVVSNYVPGTMEKLGIGYDVVKKHNPGIIYALCSGFGQNGPYKDKPAFDVIVQAMGGIISITGEPGRPPVRPGASLGDITAGLYMTIAILAALRERQVSGQGQMIDISMLDCQVALLENAFVRYLATGETPGPLGTRHPVFTPFQVFPTRDGYIAVATMGGAQDQWPVFCAIIGRTDIIDDKRFETGWLRSQNNDILEPILNEAMRQKTTSEWIHEFEAASVACGPVNTIDKVAADPQIRSRHMIVNVHHQAGGDFRIVNNPIKYSRTPCNVERASPGLGDDTEEVLKGLLTLSDREIAEMRKSGVI